jgi:branched-chain amino acid transport system ATP-binding protein
MSALLEVEGVSAGYGAVNVLNELALRVPPNRIVALLGANGAGKSTLLRTISGLLTPSRGRIRFDGEEIGGMAADRIVDRGLLQVAEGRRIFHRQTVRDNLEISLYGAGLAKSEEARRFDRAFALFPVLKEREKSLAGVLSGGQQQMLTIAQALMRGPKLLMLDEPSLGLAPIIVEQVLDVVVELARSGITILLVEQMVELALEIADYAYVLQNGSVIGEGQSKDIADSELLRSAYLGQHAK